MSAFCRETTYLVKKEVDEKTNLFLAAPEIVLVK
jgi:hypothetical protein